MIITYGYKSSAVFDNMKLSLSINTAGINVHFVHVSQQEYKCRLVNTEKADAVADKYDIQSTFQLADRVADRQPEV